MSLFWIISLVFVLYLRTLKYRYVTDDYVKRNGYLYEIPADGPDFSFWSKGPSVWYRLFMIGMHCVNVSVIYLLWGWCPALLFAVHPLAVWGTAWVTGNYYATTTYFCLIAYYILHTFPNIWGAVVAMALYTAALNSTIGAVGFPLVTMFMPFGWVMWLPLFMFFVGRRFTLGLRIRSDFHTRCQVDTRFTWKRLILMTKLVGRYIYTIFVPDRLGLFVAYGDRLHDHQDRYDKMQSVNAEFWSAFVLCLAVLVMGLIINPFAILWFFVFIGVHSQIKLMGQFYAQRYLYLPMVGLCVITGSYMASTAILGPLWVAVATFLAIRTFLFIPAWKNQESLLRSDMEAFPDNPHTFNNAVNYALTKHDGVFESQYELHETGVWIYRAMAMAPKDHEVTMNMAAYYNAIGQIRLVLHYTELTIENLKLLGDTHPLFERVYGQRDRVKARIEKLEKSGRLSFHPQSKERSDDQSKEDEGEGIKHNGSSEHSGRKEGAGTYLAGV